MNALADTLKKSTVEPIAKLIAFSIEGALNSLVPETQDSKAYSAKARSLVFNLNKNEVYTLYMVLFS